VNGVSILWLGDPERAEFRRAREVLEALGQVRHAPSADEAAAAMADGQWTPDVIVVAQTYPGQFAPTALDGLRCRAPLARVVALLGSWCEGELRSGRPAPGVIRLYWHQGPARCQRQLRRILEDRESTWDLPVTATEEERLLAAAKTPWPRRQGLVAIATRCVEMEAVLAAVCRECGYASVWLREPQAARVEGAAAAIFDAADGGQEELEQIRRLSAALAPAPLVALTDFPRIDDVARFRAAGAAAVLAKPLHVDDLVWELECEAASGPESPIPIPTPAAKPAADPSARARASL
jgi:CheY-like chemotaxis protein